MWERGIGPIQACIAAARHAWRNGGRSAIDIAGVAARQIGKGLPSSPVGRLAWTISAMTAIYIACYDPASLNARIETMGEAVAQQLLAPEYPDDQSRRIVVLETTVAGYMDNVLGLDRPLSYDELAALVDIGTDARARAIFIDHQFRNRPQDGAAIHAVHRLAGAIQRARASGIEVFTGPVRPIPELAPLFVAVQVDLARDVQHPADYNLVGSNGPRLSAAAALYRELCGGQTKDSACSPALTRRLDAAAAGRGSPLPALALRFGFADDGAPADGCARLGWRDRIGTMLAPTAGTDPCNNHLTLAVDRILRAPAPEIASVIGPELHGKVVMIGAGPELGDEHLIPAVGNIPGVAVHAMALDNLLLWGDRYPRWPPDIIETPRIGLDELLQLVVVLIVPTGLTAAARWLGSKRGSTRRRKALIMLTAVIATIVALTSIAAAGWAWLSWPAGCILLTLMLSSVVISTMSGDALSDVLSQLNTPGTALILGAAVTGAALLAGLYWSALALIGVIVALNAAAVLQSTAVHLARIRDLATRVRVKRGEHDHRTIASPTSEEAGICG